MVLLTASTISAAVSGGVICLFTFLLFLSGYVLQQQTVRSLQDALSAPVEARVRLQAPIKYAHRHDGPILQTTNDSNDTVADVGGAEAQSPDGSRVVFDGFEPSSDELTPKQLWHMHIDADIESDDSTKDPYERQYSQIREDAWSGRFAYVLSLPNPSDLCSAILFTKWQRHSSQLSRDQINIVFLYPSDWETSTHHTYADALRLLLQAEHQHDVLLHPVPISKIWTGVDVESQLLSELARNPWPYDRIIYLRTPGMLLDTDRLDQTLVSTYSDRSLLKSSWIQLRPPSRRVAQANLHPNVLLFSQGKGLMLPTGDLQARLTAQARTSDGNDHIGEAKDKQLARDAAYVLFDTLDLEHRLKERISDYGLFERFESERQKVCKDTNLLL